MHDPVAYLRVRVRLVRLVCSAADGARPLVVSPAAAADARSERLAHRRAVRGARALCARRLRRLGLAALVLHWAYAIEEYE